MPDAPLRLLSVRLRNFGCFADTGEVPIDDVTVLLAENENGKTTFLRALEWFGSTAGFDGEDRYLGAQSDERVEVMLSFELHKEAKEALVEHGFDKPPSRVRIVCDDTVTYNLFDGDKQLVPSREVPRRIPPDSPVAQARDVVRELLATQPSSTPAGDLSDLVAALDSLTWETDIEQLKNQIAERVYPHIAIPPLTPALDALTGAMAGHTDEDFDPAWDALEDFIPKFIYFDDLNDLIVDEMDYNAVVSEPARYRAMINMAKIVGIDLTKLASQGRHERQRESRRAEEILSDEASRFWDGGQIGFDITLEESAVVVSIDHNDRLQKPSRRSRGLQWFLGFFVNFKAETNDELKGAVLLLDEPGLHLHPLQQPKLLEFFDEISANNQIVYTTHLDRMIPRGRLERLRLFIEDEEHEGAVKVVSKAHALPTSEDVLAPVRASIGIGLFEAFSLGEDTIIVEGVTDYYYLHAMSDACRAAGRDALPEGASILPAVGAGSKMLPLASIAWGSGVRSIAIVDDDRAGAAAEREFSTRFDGLFKVVRVQDGGQPSGQTIEDLFDRDYFVQLVNDAYSDVPGFTAFGAGDLDAGKPATKALDEHLRRQNLGGFSKLRPALELLRRADDGVPPDTTALDNFSDLFVRANTALGEAAPRPRRRQR